MENNTDARQFRARCLAPAKTGADVADTLKVINYLEPGVKVSALSLRDRGLANNDSEPLVDGLEREQILTGKKMLDVFS
ncbi:MAG: hypothetical protein LBT86_07775 [Deltaproteobacteria bacterium]|jgi:hypothetical protein|nr:hypothetical protein [Deltaproteobacteria bacterium]